MKPTLRNIKTVENVFLKTELEDIVTEQDLLDETDNKRPEIEKKTPPSTPKRSDTSLITKLPSRKKVRFDLQQQQSQIPLDFEDGPPDQSIESEVLSVVEEVAVI